MQARKKTRIKNSELQVVRAIVSRFEGVKWEAGIRREDPTMLISELVTDHRQAKTVAKQINEQYFDCRVYCSNSSPGNYRVIVNLAESVDNYKIKLNQAEERLNELCKDIEYLKFKVVNPEEGYYLPQLCIEMEKLDGRQNYRDIEFSAYTPHQLLDEIFQRVARETSLVVGDEKYEPFKNTFSICFAKKQQNKVFDIVYMNGCYLLELTKIFSRADFIRTMPLETRENICAKYFSHTAIRLPKDVGKLIARFGLLSPHDALAVHKATAKVYNTISKKRRKYTLKY